MSKARLDNHANTHLGVKPYLCKVCGRGFAQKPNLERHERSVHSSERLFVCAVCGKQLYDKYALSQHQRIHVTDNKFECKTCGKKFKGSQNLRHHEKVHLSLRPHLCKQCGKSFYQTSALKRHERTHSGERPYSCAICQRAFNDRSSLRNHMYLHTDQRPYTCRVCTKTFIRLNRLKKHEQGHFGDEPSNLPPPEKTDALIACEQVFDSTKNVAVANAAPVPAVTSSVSDEWDVYCRNYEGLKSFQAAGFTTGNANERFVYPNIDDQLYIQPVAIHSQPMQQPVQQADNTQIFYSRTYEWEANPVPVTSTVVTTTPAVEQPCQNTALTEVKPSPLPYIIAPTLVDLALVAADVSNTSDAISNKEQEVSPALVIENQHVDVSIAAPLLPPISKDISPSDETVKQESSCVQQSETVRTTKNSGKKKGTIYSCDICNKEFSYKSHVKAHQQSAHPANTHPYTCPDCGKGFRLARQLDVHLRTHTGERPFICQFCGKSFIAKSYLDDHERVHRREPSYRCVDCGRCFVQKINLRRHRARSHGAEGDGCVECTVCSKLCYDKYALKAHMVTHRTEMNFQCKTCGKLFKGSQHLRHHERTHLSLRPHLCKQCGKSFYQTSALKRHERTHSGEKPYECTQCSRCFSDCTSLKNHKYTHTADKPFRCEECGKTFIKLFRFKRHVLTQQCKPTVMTVGVSQQHAQPRQQPQPPHQPQPPQPIQQQEGYRDLYGSETLITAQLSSSAANQPIMVTPQQYMQMGTHENLARDNHTTSAQVLRDSATELMHHPTGYM